MGKLLKIVLFDCSSASNRGNHAFTANGRPRNTDEPGEQVAVARTHLRQQRQAFEHSWSPCTYETRGRASQTHPRDAQVQSWVQTARRLQVFTLFTSYLHLKLIINIYLCFPLILILINDISEHIIEPKVTMMTWWNQL